MSHSAIGNQTVGAEKCLILYCVLEMLSEEASGDEILALVAGIIYLLRVELVNSRRALSAEVLEREARVSDEFGGGKLHPPTIGSLPDSFWPA
jgi:hypothetical protein